MLDFFGENPGILVACLALMIPILGIVFGTVTGYLTRVRRAEIEASLKMEMLQRGMSAEDIKMVIEAMPRKNFKNKPASERQWS